MVWHSTRALPIKPPGKISNAPFAEFERTLINERQQEGIALAKQRGAYRGRKKALPPDAVTKLRARIATGTSKAKVAREFGISRQTLYQYLQGGEGAR
jgi:DNA invertase Pin-like site-specific DNA recombinase